MFLTALKPNPLFSTQQSLRKGNTDFLLLELFPFVLLVLSLSGSVSMSHVLLRKEKRSLNCDVLSVVRYIVISAMLQCKQNSAPRISPLIFVLEILQVFLAKAVLLE